MSNTVEFILKLKDLMSSGVQKVASTAQSSFSTVDRIVNRTQGNFNRLGSNISDLNKRLDDLKRTRELSVDTRQIRNANREIDRVERRINRIENLGRRTPSSGGGMLGSLAIPGIGALGVAGAITAGAMGIGSSITAGMQGGAQKVSFETMAGAQAGNKLYGDLTKYAQDSIFGNELYQNAQTMLAFGGAAKDVMPDLKMLGDISMGNKEKLQSLTLAFSQIRSAGRLMGQDLLQLVNAGFNPLQIISEKTGKSMADLKKLVEKGAVSFDMVKQAFISATSEGGRFFNMTNKIAETPFGKWEAFKGQLEGVALQFGTVMLPVVSKVVDGFSSLLNYLPPVINSMQPFFGWLASLELGSYFNDFIVAVKSVGTVVIPIFQTLKPVVSTALIVFMDLAKEVRGFVTTLLTSASPVLLDVARILGNVLTPALKITGWALGKVLSIAGWVIDKLLLLIKPIVKLFAVVSDGVGWMLDKVANVVDTKMPAISDKIKAGINRDDVSAFFKKIGELHGINYSQGLTEKLKRLAIGMDNFYHTNAFTNKYAELFGGAQLAEVTVSAKATPRKSLTPFGGDFSSVSDKSDKINGGGVRTINITIGKFFEDFIIKTETVTEGIGELEHKIEEALYRVLNSGNAIQDN